MQIPGHNIGFMLNLPLSVIVTGKRSWRHRGQYIPRFNQERTATMTSAPAAVKTRHKEYSLLFPLAALGVLSFWGTATDLGVLVVVNIVALLGILVSAFNVVRHADVLAHRLGEPLGSLILTLSVVILEVSLISALMATGADARYAVLGDYDSDHRPGRLIVAAGRQ